jgi:hypothetical protein
VGVFLVGADVGRDRLGSNGALRLGGAGAGADGLGGGPLGA